MRLRLQAAYWRNRLGLFTAQAEELRALSTNVTADIAEPIKAHVTRGMNEFRKASWISSLYTVHIRRRGPARICWPLAFAAGILAVGIAGRSPC